MINRTSAHSHTFLQCVAKAHHFLETISYYKEEKNQEDEDGNIEIMVIERLDKRE